MVTTYLSVSSFAEMFRAEKGCNTGTRKKILQFCNVECRISKWTLNQES